MILEGVDFPEEVGRVTLGDFFRSMKNIGVE